MESGLLFWATVAGVLAVLAGGYVIYRGFRDRTERNLLAETPTEPVGSLSVGLSGVEGEAVPHPDHGTMTSPFSEYTDCLVAEWEVLSSDEGTEHAVASGVDGVPFLVDDGTGQLLVRPEDATVEVDHNRWRGARTGDDWPAVQSFLDRPDTPDPTGDGFQRRYRQFMIRPGDEVYVYGRVEPRDGVDSPDNADNLVLQREADPDDEDLEPLFLVSNLSKGELRADRGRLIPLSFLPLGGFLVTAGVAILAWSYGAGPLGTVVLAGLTLVGLLGLVAVDGYDHPWVRRLLSG